MIHAAEFTMAELVFPNVIVSGGEPAVGHPSGHADKGLPERSGAAAFESALVDELARDRSFHAIDGQSGLQPSFERASGPSPDLPTVDPVDGDGVLPAGLRGAAGAFKPVDFGAETGNAREAGLDEPADVNREPTSAPALRSDGHLAPGWIASIDLTGAEALPVDEPASGGRVFFNGDGRPIILPLAEGEQPVALVEPYAMADDTWTFSGVDLAPLAHDPVEAFRDSMLHHVEMLSEHMK